MKTGYRSFDQKNHLHKILYTLEDKAYSVLLLHLSDIHFRQDEIGTPMDPNYHLGNELLLDAEEMCKRLGEVPSAILISGDIAFSAHAEEYDFALSWLEKLAANCGTTTECVFAVPGNHDVVRTMASTPMVRALHEQIKSTKPIFIEGRLRELLQDPESIRVLYTPLNQFNLFAGQFFCDVSAPMRTIAKRDLKLNDGSTLRLTGFNSALVSSIADKKDDLYVDPACFQITREPGVECLTLCHHPFSWLRQGEALKSHLNDVARIQLFGHKHTSRIELARDSVHISAGAVHPDPTEHGWEPGYNLIKLDIINAGTERKLSLVVHVRVWQSNPGQFIAKKDRENDFFQHQIILDSWAPLPVETELAADSSELTIPESAHQMQAPQAVGNDPMDSLRSISIRFFKLTFSQKSAIAGKLGLLEDEDMNQPDFERFRNVLLRARERGLLETLDKEVSDYDGRGQETL